MIAHKIILHRLKRGEENWAAGIRWVAMVYSPKRKGKGYIGDEFTTESEAVIWGAREAASLGIPLFKEDRKGREVEVSL